MANLHNDLFSSLISEIKSYTGNDPLLPWLRGIRKMRDTLSPQLLRQKLPRFLQKCAETFENDRHYANDLRYIRVWLQLMDYLDHPKAALRSMEEHRIGIKKSLFYQAYALYYEKMKKFEEADKMYHLGVVNLAEPVAELQNSYEQFLHRMERHKNKKIRHQLLSKDQSKNKGFGCKGSFKQHPRVEAESSEPRKFQSDDTVVVKFVETAIVGKTDAEDARHHGLVEPTINTKEAMNAINGMFREPLEPVSVVRRSQKSQLKSDQCLNNGFEVFVDDNLADGLGSSTQVRDGLLLPQFNWPETHQHLQEPFQIYIDDEESNELNGRLNAKEQNMVQNLTEGTSASCDHVNAFVFPSPNDLASDCHRDLDVESSPQPRFREDTVVYRFVGSTISDEPEVENVCHHGLVEPTINLKEAMEDINNMFGKTIEFSRKTRAKKQDKAPDRKKDCGEFLILPDDDSDCQQQTFQPSSSAKNESDLFEATMCTREAMDEINKMFGMPLDF